MKLKLTSMIVCVVFLCGENFAMLNRSTKIYKDYYPNGKIRKVTKVKIAASATWELYSYYKRTAVYVTEFFENGKIKSTLKRVTKIGNSGKPCYEIIEEKKYFTDTGVILKVEKNVCDKGKIVTKHYDESGNLVFVKIDYAYY